MKLIFNPCGEFRWSQEGPVSQIHSPHLHDGAPGIFSSLFRWNRESGVQKAMGSYRTYPSIAELQPWFLSLQWKTCLWTELQLWFLSLQWRICPWAEHTDDYDVTWNSVNSNTLLPTLIISLTNFHFPVCVKPVQVIQFFRSNIQPMPFIANG